MAIIQSLNVLLKADTSNYNKGLKKSSKDTSSWASSISGTFGGLTGMVGAAAASLGVLSAGAFVGWGVKLAGEAEAAKVGFTTMLGSAQEATKLLADIQKFGAETPFETSELTQGTRSLLSFGVASKDVMGVLKTLGDVASGSQSEITDLALIYGKTLAKGKFELEQGNQLAERGIPIYSTLAKQLGISQAELMNTISAGKVSAAQVKTAFETMAGSGGIFEDAMKKQSVTLLGMWSTFIDGITMVATDVGQVLVEALDLKGVIGGFTSLTDAIRSKIAEWKPVFVAFVGVVKIAFTQIASIYTSVWNGMVSVAAPIMTWLMESAGVSFTSFRDTALSALFALQYGWSNIGTIFWLGVDAVLLALSHMVTNLGSMLKWGYQTVVNFSSNLILSLVNAMSTLKMLFKEIWDYVKSGGTNAIELNFDTHIPLNKWFAEYDGKMTETEQELANSIKDRSNALIGGLSGYVGGKMKELDKIVSTVPELAGAVPADQPVEENASAKSSTESPAAIEAGSIAAYTALNKARKEGDPTTKAITEQTKEIQKTNSKLDALVTAQRTPDIVFALS